MVELRGAKSFCQKPEQKPQAEQSGTSNVLEIRTTALYEKTYTAADIDRALNAY